MAPFASVSKLIGPALRWAGGAALDVLLPPQCLTCDTPVGAPGQFCAGCFRRTAFVTAPLCARCGVPFASAQQGGLDRVCVSCRAEPPPWSEARAALRYDEQARRLLLPLKYGDRTELAAALARHMARAGAGLLARADLLVPVPLHRARLRSRRYNQSALLAAALARLSGRAAVLDGLVRTRATAPLAEKSLVQRQAEVAGAFMVRATRRARLEGARVLLVDDVMTSGSTAGACTRALLGAGVLEVAVLVGARVADPRQE